MLGTNKKAPQLGASDMKMSQRNENRIQIGECAADMLLEAEQTAKMRSKSVQFAHCSSAEKQLERSPTRTNISSAIQNSAHDHTSHNHVRELQ